MARSSTTPRHAGLLARPPPSPTRRHPPPASTRTLTHAPALLASCSHCARPHHHQCPALTRSTAPPEAHPPASTGLGLCQLRSRRLPSAPLRRASQSAALQFLALLGPASFHSLAVSFSPAGRPLPPCDHPPSSPAARLLPQRSPGPHRRPSRLRCPVLPCACPTRRSPSHPRSRLRRLPFPPPASRGRSRSRLSLILHCTHHRPCALRSSNSGPSYHRDCPPLPRATARRRLANTLHGPLAAMHHHRL